MIAIHRPDADSARDVLKTWLKADGASKLKDTGFPIVRYERRPIETAPPTVTLFAQRGPVVFGVSDEEHVLGPGVTAEQRRARTLDDPAKLELLQALVVAK